jgi:anthranilate phosphoribosyltransferase|tara:strand:- start:311 stop:1330 length:1020 start_codon:yes stop_codon:yes gene_type:complete
MSTITKYTELAKENDLSEQDTSAAFNIIMDGKSELDDLILFLETLNNNGINQNHVLGAVNIMRQKMIAVDIPLESIDTCGTGGDGKFTLNVSTAVAFVLSALGIPVAKHGNRSITSNCGSADVLKALGINIDMQTDKISECIEKTGICFMFAPNHHPAMKHVAEARQILGKKGVKTIFNMLGPLLNPGNVKKQIIGVFSSEIQKIYKEVFNKSSDREAFIVYGADGMDEISTEGSNKIAHKDNLFDFDPFELEIKRPNVIELTGENPEFNASRIIDIFSGKKDSFYDIVSINAALGLVLDRNLELNNKNISICLNDVGTAMNDGTALDKIEQLKMFTNK